MWIMKKIENAILEHFSKRGPQEFYKHVWIFFGCFTLILGAASYYIHQASLTLITDIALVQKKALEARHIEHTYKNILEFKTNIFKQLESHVVLDIKSYFETICRQVGLSPESNWTPSKNPLPFNRDLEESILQARFKNMTMQKLISLLTTLTKNEMVYARSIRLTKDFPQQKVFNVELHIGTYNYKEQEAAR